MAALRSGPETIRQRSVKATWLPTPGSRRLTSSSERPWRSSRPSSGSLYYYRAALGYIAAQPGDWLLLLGRKFFYTWVPVGPSYTLHSALYYRTTVLTYVPLLLLAAAALPALVRSPTPPRALALLVASAVLVCLAFFPQERFRIPVVDPALCVAAAAWIAPRVRRT